LQLLHSEFPYMWGKLVFLFYQCTWLDLIYTWLDLIHKPDACEYDEDATVFSSFLILFGNYLVLRAEKIGAIVPDPPPPPSTFFQTSCVSLNHCQETIKNLCFFKDTIKRLEHLLEHPKTCIHGRESNPGRTLAKSYSNSLLNDIRNFYIGLL
jgi:hypothetical protein